MSLNLTDEFGFCFFLTQSTRIEDNIIAFRAIRVEIVESCIPRTIAHDTSLNEFSSLFNVLHRLIYPRVVWVGSQHAFSAYFFVCIKKDMYCFGRKVC